ncbi:hypothetical protein [Brevifollis gellanilyticus]|uniref:Uncharacterized protein n=1 Tax=Brevifollis gellanilyticus TaxID=748831 RepID=A0A512M266_9BACT|nr:hypothetical protein [Brevifollis gellanilyticus]GEP40825.1 hypothetical protein BGE01nite_01160 [Brevifollis gellanilyticus]
MKVSTHTCPVCGFDQLKEAPRSKSGSASFEICPACGFQFGVSDDDDGLTYDEWREDWITRGMEWSSRGIKTPRGWKPEALLKSVLKKKK